MLMGQNEYILGGAYFIKPHKTAHKKGAVIVTAGELPLLNRKIESEKLQRDRGL